MRPFSTEILVSESLGLKLAEIVVCHDNKSHLKQKQNPDLSPD